MTGLADNDKTPFHAGEWYVEPELLQIRRGLETVKVEPKVMAVLVYLAHRQGEVVRRRELEEQVWPGSVVSYDALSTTIRKLRLALQDDVKQPRLIETLPKRGYRLIATVRFESPTEQTTPEPAQFPAQPATQSPAQPPGPPHRKTVVSAQPAVTSPPPSKPPPPPPRRPSLWVMALAVAAVAVFIGLVYVFTAPSSPASPTVVAVLPFKNMSGDASQDYFGFGISEDIATDLGLLSRLQVISPATLTTYATMNKNTHSVARELGAQYIVEGSVRRENDQLRVTSRLTHAESGHQLWAMRFDRQPHAIFEVQDEISLNIVNALQIKLSGKEKDRVTKNYSADIRAYDTLLKGLNYFARQTREGNQQARLYYENAIDLDPQFARAYSTLANTYRREYQNGWTDKPQQAMEHAQRLAEKALALSNQPETLFTLGVIHRDKQQLEQAIQYAKLAAELNPHYADAYVLLGSSLCFSGRATQGLELIARARRIKKPAIPSNYYFYQGMCHFAASRLPDAIKAFQTGLNINPTSQRMRLLLIASYALHDDLEKARWEATELQLNHPQLPVAVIIEHTPFQSPSLLNQWRNGLEIAGVLD